MNIHPMELALADENATLGLGAALARSCPDEARVVHLSGDLGAGKTTLVRGWLRALGHSGAVKSPTYTLVETYDLGGRPIHHFDLYRLADPEELEYLGLDGYFDGRALCLVEWPERGKGIMGCPDLSIRLTVAGEGRRAVLEGFNGVGRMWLERLD